MSDMAPFGSPFHHIPTHRSGRSCGGTPTRLILRQNGHALNAMCWNGVRVFLSPRMPATSGEVAGGYSGGSTFLGGD